MPNHSPGDSSGGFEWPPREDVLESQILRLGDRVPQATAPATPPNRPASSAAPAPQPAPLEEPPHVALRRMMEERAAAQSRIENTSRTATTRKVQPWWRSFSHPTWRAPRLVPIALVALTLIAVLQGAYILRSLWWPSADVEVTSDQIEAPSTEAPVAPVVQAKPAGRTSSTAGTSGRDGSPPAAKSRLVIRSEPSGARVSVDGRYRGVTPVTLTNVKPGEYRVALEGEGAEVRQTVRVDAGATVSVVAPMRAGAQAPGWIALDSPIDLDVFEEGSLLGTSRSSRILLQAGPHTLQLVNEQLNFREVRQVQVEARGVVSIPVELPQANVQVNATPWAEVWVDGKHVGQTPIGRLSLAIGTHEVVFRHPELGEKTTTAVVKAGAPTRVAVDLRPHSPSTSRQ